MPDPASTALTAPRLALGDGTAAYEAAVELARARTSGRTGCSRATCRCGSSDPRVGEAIAERLGWLDAPAHFAERIAGLEGFGDAVVDEGYTTASSPGWAAAASPRTSSAGRSASSRATSPCASSTRPIRPTCRRRSTTSIRSGRSSSSPRSRARRPSRTRSSPTPGPRAEAALERGPPSPLRAARRVLRGHHRPGQQRRGHRPPRRLPRGLHQPARHRRPLLGADLRRPRPGLAHRHRPRRRCSRRPSAMLGACREPDPALEPGRLARAGDRDAGEGRPRQADLPDRRRDRQLRGVGRAAHRREHRQARRRHRPGRPRAGRRGRVVRPGPGVRPDLAGRVRWRRRATTLASALEAAGHPVIRIDIADPIDLGAEFVRWEVATAIAGAVLGIDPFDQPNVEEAKQLTRDVLDAVGRAHGDARHAGRRARSRSATASPCTATRRSG